MTAKLVRITKCKACPLAAWRLNTAGCPARDPDYQARLYVACGALKPLRPFDLGANWLEGPEEIPAWCPLPDAPERPGRPEGGE